MIKQVSFAIAILLTHSVYSQEYFQSNIIVKENITYQKLTDDGSGREVFSILASENNIDARKITLQTKFRILISISRNYDNRLTAKISMTRVSIEGNTIIQKFNVDTLLWPTGFTAQLELFNGNHKNDVIYISGSANGKISIIDLSDQVSPTVGDLSARVSEFKFNYDEVRLQELKKLTKTIDYYYSYVRLLKNLIKENNTTSINNDKSVHKIFISKIEINRIRNFIADHNFMEILNLGSNDPAAFLKLTKKLERLSQRANTIFNQTLSGKSSDSLNPMAFCKLYCDLSLQYLRKTKLLQPSEASGYEEVANIDTSANAENNIRSITQYYNKYSLCNSHEIYKCLFGEFVATANTVMTDDDFAGALLLLNNANIIHNWFKTTITPNYNSALMSALDGVASSYLSVGSGAISINNFELATSYFDKADEVFELNQGFINTVNLPDSAFSKYFKLQYEIAIQYNSLGKFEEAIARLSTAQKICRITNNSRNCRILDPVTCVIHAGFIDLSFNKMENLIADGQYSDAKIQLAKASDYLLQSNCLQADDNSRFNELAYMLFLGFLNQGEALLELQQSSLALENLLNAKSLQKYLNDDIIEVNRLIELAVEPEIIELIQQAKYHSWANRIIEAKSLYTEANRLNEKYFASKNLRINTAIFELSEQMKSRKCVSNKIKYSDILTKINLAIKKYQFNKLEGLLNEADEFRINHSECNIDDNEVNTTREKYNEVLNFYKQYNTIIDMLFSKGYKEVIPLYIALNEYYNLHNLFQYDIYFPSLESFIITQKSPHLTMETANFYLQNNDPVTSFYYVKIFKDQRGNSKIIKPITTEIAKQFAIRDDKVKAPVNEMLDEYTSGDNWYSHFKSAYLKFRILNKVK